MNLAALTIHQPWASAIAAGVKPIENRTFEPPSSVFGSRLAIHAGKRIDGDGILACKELGFEIAPDDMPISAIIAVATVIGWVGTLGYDGLALGRADDRARWRKNPWFNPRPENIGWILDDVIALPTPVPCRGFQGVWWAAPEIVDQVLEQIARVCPEVRRA